jgi:hypothetical protein
VLSFFGENFNIAFARDDALKLDLALKIPCVLQEN